MEPQVPTEISTRMGIFDWLNVKKDIFDGLLVVKAAKKGLSAGKQINHGLVSVQEHTKEFAKDHLKHSD